MSHPYRTAPPPAATAPWRPGSFVRRLGRVLLSGRAGWSFRRCDCGGHWEKDVPWGDGVGRMYVPGCRTDAALHVLPRKVWR